MTASQFHAEFVDAYPGSTSRRTLFQQWQAHQVALATITPVLWQWIDGSYVTSKLDPEDIDVVTFLDGPTVDDLPGGQQLILQSLVSGPVTKATWGMDSYFVPMYPEGHPLHDVYLHGRGYWDWWLGRVRGRDAGVKGYLEVR